jgi:hypothetical protein
MGDAMRELKKSLTKAPVLVSLDFSASALGIELGIDASTTVGWGAVLSQYWDDGKLHPARFESGIWSESERKYDALKLEYRGLIKALKKLRVLAIRMIFYGYNGFANPRLATQPTSERPSKRDDDSMARVCTTF